jgi:hypothetical protein
MPPRMTPAEFLAWVELRDFRDWYGLTPRELGWMFHRSESTVKRKLSGNKRITVMGGWLGDKLLLLAAGIRPHRWPHDLPPASVIPLNRARRRRIEKARQKMGEKRYPCDPLSARFGR